MMECKSASRKRTAIFPRRKSCCASAESRPRQEASRTTKQGTVGSYIHTGAQLGVLVESKLRVHFVARTDDFQELVRGHRDAQFAAADPQFIRKKTSTPAVLEQGSGKSRKPAR